MYSCVLYMLHFTVERSLLIIHRPKGTMERSAQHFHKMVTWLDYMVIPINSVHVWSIWSPKKKIKKGVKGEGEELMRIYTIVMDKAKWIENNCSFYHKLRGFGSKGVGYCETVTKWGGPHTYTIWSWAQKINRSIAKHPKYFYSTGSYHVNLTPSSQGILVLSSPELNQGL